MMERSSASWTNEAVITELDHIAIVPPLTALSYQTVDQVEGVIDSYQQHARYSSVSTYYGPWKNFMSPHQSDACHDSLAKAKFLLS
jgi:hypothetical protein